MSHWIKFSFSLRHEIIFQNLGVSKYEIIYDYFFLNSQITHNHTLKTEKRAKPILKPKNDIYNRNKRYFT